MKLISALAMLALFGCATTKAPKDSGNAKVVAPAFYTLKEGAKAVNKTPLPNKTEIMVNWTYTDGSKKTKEGFVGWDLDHDGRFDMLEVLGPDGEPQMWAYDFDGDGVIDAVDKSKMEQNLTADAKDVIAPKNQAVTGSTEAPKEKPAPAATEDLSTDVKADLKPEKNKAEEKKPEVKKSVEKEDLAAPESLKTPPPEPKKRMLLKPADAPKEKAPEKTVEDLKAELREAMSPDAPAH
ncbi:MAG: hypothetical protein WCO71_03705 [Pseudomonadota bacterium]